MEWGPTSARVIPPRSLVAGIPGWVRRELTDDEVAGIVKNGTGYLDLAKRHASGEFGGGLFQNWKGQSL